MPLFSFFKFIGKKFLFPDKNHLFFPKLPYYAKYFESMQFYKALVCLMDVR